MAITESAIIDRIEVIADGTIQVRKAVLVLKDGVEIARSNNRYCLTPGQDVSKEDPRVAAVAAAMWTKEVVDAWSAANEPASVPPSAP